MSFQTYLSHFRTIRPSYESSQEHLLDWLLAAHTKAEAMSKKQDLNLSQINEFQQQLKERLHHVSCKPADISRRGHELKDFLHKNWNEMEIYNLENAPRGEDLTKRNNIYVSIVDTIFERYYPEQSAPPQDLIHVSCTGYASPSGAQKIAAKRNWRQTTVTHAYHMGCYASIPALRMASGFNRNHKEHRTDIVHTELCSLHYNPARHASDQLVIHSLFADGFIKYSLHSNTEEKHPSLKILGIFEQLIPNSSKLMLWNLDSHGFYFSLDKDIPMYIARSLSAFFKELCGRAGIKENEMIENAIFTIHPGGPKIIKYIKNHFGCSDGQMHISYSILKKYGNMSSCTLPQMWAEICEDDEIPNGSKVVSMAFGPGLTMAGVILEKFL
ncbi:MAG TPA: 3-oxoacyl-[acyl-carrier-protein] synthase III C-terminal domain-containing protein [Waddliaceae bacterium]